MPLGKSYSKYRRGRYHRYRKRSSKSLLGRMRSIAKSVFKTNTETHYINCDTTVAGVAIDSVGVVPLNFTGALSQGTADTQRIGDSITPRHVSCKGQIAVGDGTNTVRLILVQWLVDITQDTFVGTEILQATSNVLAPYQPYSKDYQWKKFRPLWDHMYVVSSDGKDVVNFSFEIPANKLSKVQYTAGASSASKGQIFLFAISDSDAVAHPLITAVGRIMYYT